MANAFVPVHDDKTSTATGACLHFAINTMLRIDDDDGPPVPQARHPTDDQQQGFMSLAELGKHLPDTTPATSHPPPPPPAADFVSLANLLEHLPTIPPPPNPLPTPLPFTYDAFPHLIDQVATHADLATLLAIRHTCRGLMSLADSILAATPHLNHGTNGTPGYMHPVPGAEGHTRALLPPYTVIDRVAVLHSDSMTQVALPPGTRRHVVVVVFDPAGRTLPYTMSVSPEISDGPDLARPADSDSRTRGRFPGMLDVVFEADPLLWLEHDVEDEDRNSDSDAGKADDDDEGNRARELLFFRMTHKMMDMGHPPANTFFGYVIRYLSVAHRIMQDSGTVRLWGLQSLGHALINVPESFATGSVVDAALEVLRDKVEWLATYYYPSTYKEGCFDRLEAYETTCRA